MASLDHRTCSSCQASWVPGRVACVVCGYTHLVERHKEPDPGLLLGKTPAPSKTATTPLPPLPAAAATVTAAPATKVPPIASLLPAAASTAAATPAAKPAPDKTVAMEEVKDDAEEEEEEEADD